MNLKIKPTKDQARKIIYLISILGPSLLTGNVFSSISQDKTTDALLSKISALSSSVHSNIESSQSHFSYSLNVLLKNPAFYTLDIPQLSKLIAEFQFYNPNIGNCYIVDATNQLLYGLNDTALLKITDYSHINNALKGSASTFSTFINDVYFLQIALPIFTSASTTIPSAVFILTYDFTPFYESLASLSKSGTNIHAYLFNKDGKTIISSDDSPISKFSGTADLNRVKLTLDLDPTATFTLFDETTYHGTYFDIDGDLTVLVTTPSYSGIVLEDLIGFLMGALGLGSAATSKLIKSNELDTPSSSARSIDI